MATRESSCQYPCTEHGGCESYSLKSCGPEDCLRLPIAQPKANDVYELDKALFYWINHGWTHPIADAFFPWITHLKNMGPVIIPLVLWMLTRCGRRGRICILTLGLTIAATDQFCCNVLKPGVNRMRPCNALEDTVLRVKRRKSPSFPSAHAANIFAAAVVFRLFYKRSIWIGLPIASAVALSRVYTGVHYPSDIACGALIGSGIATGTTLGMRRLGQHVSWLALPASDTSESPQKNQKVSTADLDA
ncbi:MAG: membrane-associated phospholipid phosphatase [Planctomycetota bacterium]|jgi:membrane-associated phospholipid phosphatase